MRTVLMGIIILMVSGVVWCEDEPENKFRKVFEKDKVLQKNVKKVTTKMDKEDKKLKEAQRKHRESIAKLKKELIGVYEASMKKYTKKGDIRSATAMMEQIDKMKKGEDTPEDVYVLSSESTIIVNAGEIGVLSNKSKLFSNRDYSLTLIDKKLIGMNFVVLPIKSNSPYKVVPNKKQKIYVLVHQNGQINIALNKWKKETLKINHNIPGAVINIFSRTINKPVEIPSCDNITPIIVAEEIKKSED